MKLADPDGYLERESQSCNSRTRTRTRPHRLPISLPRTSPPTSSPNFTQTGSGTVMPQARGSNGTVRLGAKTTALPFQWARELARTLSEQSRQGPVRHEQDELRGRR